MSANHGDHLKVTYASLDDAADAIMREAKHLRQDLEKLQRKIRSVSSLWEGEAHQAYLKVQHQWDVKADDLQNRLLSIAGEVRIASGNYNATDIKASKMF
ncbi:WXG100 family type VII secretion target [Streptomyces smyrnaeus]|uniref:WXG100 family type VII secretion target n=1 Tax=Streptomyces smyrnaeus TaxID=1387713 RepID=UPI0033DC9217